MQGLANLFKPRDGWIGTAGLEAAHIWLFNIAAVAQLDLGNSMRFADGGNPLPPFLEK
jgi:hypothetical protein